MKLLYDAFTEPEPHYAQIIKADKLKPIEVYPKDENKNPLAIWDVKDAGVTRKGNEVLAKVVLVRSTITPTAIEVEAGRHGQGRPDQHRADDRRAPRLRPARLQHQHRLRPRRDQDRDLQGRQAGRLSLLLHELLLCPPPGDAGLPHRQAEEGLTRPEDRAAELLPPPPGTHRRSHEGHPRTEQPGARTAPGHAPATAAPGGRAAARPDLPHAALEADDVRPAVPGRAAAATSTATSSRAATAARTSRKSTSSTTTSA